MTTYGRSEKINDAKANNDSSVSSSGKSDNSSGKGKRSSIFISKVVGVTFSNPDGENRQEIIRGIINKDGNGRYWTGQGHLRMVEASKVDPNWDGAAIEVYVKGKLIGFVPKDKVVKVAFNRKTQSCSALVQLKYNPEVDVCSAALYEQTRNLPTPRMKATVEKILLNNPKLNPPENTFDAYRRFLNKYYGENGKQLRFQGEDYL